MKFENDNSGGQKAPLTECITSSELRGSNSEFDPLISLDAVGSTPKNTKKLLVARPTEAVQGDWESDLRGSNSEFDPLSSLDVMHSVKGAFWPPNAFHCKSNPVSKKKNGWPWRLPFENQINYPSSNTYWVFGPPWTWSGQGKVKDNDPLAPAAPGLTVVKLWNPRGILYPPTPAVTKEGLGLSQHKSTHHMQSPFRICYILRDMRWNNMYWCMSCTVGGVSISLSFFHGKPVGGCKPAAVTLRLAYWLVVPKKQGNKASSSKWISIAWKWVSLSDKVYENQRFLPWIIYKIPKFCLSNRPPQALTAPGSYSPRLLQHRSSPFETRSGLNFDTLNYPGSNLQNITKQIHEWMSHILCTCTGSFMHLYKDKFLKWFLKKMPCARM